MKEETINSNGFEAFGLNSAINRAVADAGFVTPTPIQTSTIPAALAGRDILGLAQTGTGKTAAFALPILQKLMSERKLGPRALIVAPTRELAQQIDAEFHVLGKYASLRTATVYGGVSERAQMQELRMHPDVIVACPGRLLAHVRQRCVDLSHVEVLVLDEADHMFDMGFLPDVRRIVAALPRTRQNLLFSATMPSEIRHLTKEILRDPHCVELATQGPAKTVEHALYPVAEGHKFELLSVLLEAQDCDSAIVFSRTKHRAKRLARDLAARGHRAIALQGNMSQAQRDRAMEGFRQRAFTVLVATDIAARGIDVAKVSHVINYDVPQTADAYTHRLGRTGRADCFGKAFTLATSDDHSLVRAIEQSIGTTLPRCRMNLPGGPPASPLRDLPADAKMPQPPRHRPRGNPQRSGAFSSRSDVRATTPSPRAKPIRRGARPAANRTSSWSSSGAPSNSTRRLPAL